MQLSPHNFSLIVLLIIGAELFTPGQSPPETNVLTPDQAIERRFQLGEVHKFEFHADAGHFFKIVLDQKSVDLGLKIVPPNGTPAASVNARTRGVEQTFWVSQLAGSFLLEVSSRRRCDPIRKVDCAGTFRLVVTDHRNAGPVDLIRHSAQLLSIKERSLGPSYSLNELVRNERVAMLKELRRLWSRASEPVQEALVVEALAAEAWTQRNSQEMIRLYSEALMLWRAAADHMGESEALSSLGRTYQGNGELQKALDHYEQALVIARSNDDRDGEIQLMFQLGGFFSYINEPRMAVHFYNKTLERSREEKAGNFGGLTGAAAAYEKLGDGAKANELRRLALAEIKAAGYPVDDKRLIVGLSRIYGELGEYELQAEVDEREIELARKQNNKFEEMITVAGAANTYFRAGKYAKAIDYYRQALSMRGLFDRSDLSFIYLEGLGDTYSAIGNFEAAVESYLEAYSIKSMVAVPHYRAAIVHRLAKAYSRLGDNDRARAFGEDAVATIESVRASLSSPAARRSFSTSNQAYYEFYIDLLLQLQKRHPAGEYGTLAFNFSERARARSLLESLARSGVDIKKGISAELLEREKAVRLDVNTAAERQARLLITKHTPEQVAEADKSLHDAIARAEEIAGQIRNSSAAYAAVTQPQSLTVKGIQDGLLDEDTILLEYALGEERSYVWAISPTKSESFQLPKRTEVEVVAKRVYTLMADSKRWSNDDTIGAEYSRAAGELSELVLGPVAGMIRGKRLVVVADGFLHYIPFSALPAPKVMQERPGTKNASQSLIATNEVVHLPSASVLAVLRREAANRSQRSGGIAVVADPVFSETDGRLLEAKGAQKASSKNDLTRMQLERALSFGGEDNESFTVPRLPFTRREADSIFASAAKNTSIKALDFDADRETLLKTDLSKYRIIHFATHGILHSEHPELSGIILSLVNQKGEPINGFMRLNEIYNMNLNADLVVLSACQTALGKEVRGEGLIGLTRGFMYAGSPRVVASLWKVDDVATAELMKIFYQKMLKEKMRPAAALREAKIAMMKQKRWSSPYYWAAFELHGDWR